MKITYDAEADALYILVHAADAGDSVDVQEGITIDLDANGEVIGIEILDASKRMTSEELTSVSYENLLLAASTLD
jgi:uncharacterized protein YuzE